MNKRKWLAIVLALTMVFTMMPAMAFADGVDDFTAVQADRLSTYLVQGVEDDVTDAKVVFTVDSKADTSNWNQNSGEGSNQAYTYVGVYVDAPEGYKSLKINGEGDPSDMSEVTAAFLQGDRYQHWIPVAVYENDKFILFNGNRDYKLLLEWTMEDESVQKEYVDITRNLGKVEDEIVAKNGSRVYEDLQDAINGAEAGDVIELTKDITLTETIDINKKITLDTNGYTLDLSNTRLNISSDVTLTDTSQSEGGKIISSDIAVQINVSAKATIDGNINIESTTSGGILLSANSELTVNGGSIIGYYYAIVGNGTYDNTTIIINDGYIEGKEDLSYPDDAVAIYHPQLGDLIINGGTLVGESGIQYCGAGNVTITGGTIQAKANYTEFPEKTAAEGDGTAIDGAALSFVSRGGGYQDNGATINVNISGGKFISDNNSAISVYRLQKKNSNWITNENTSLDSYLASLNISGGELISGDQKDALEIDTAAANAITVSGGTFSTDPSDYVADGYAAVANGDEFIVGTQTTEGNTTITVAPAVDETLTGEDKETATAIAEKIGTDVVTGLDGAVAEEVTDVTVVVTVKAVDLENDTFTVSIEPKQADGSEVTVTGTVTVKLPAPDGFPTKNVYVKHTKENGDVYKYKATVSGGFITFTNPNGFSDFEVYVGSSSSNGYVQQKTLTFDTNGGSKIDAVTANYGKTIVLADYTPKRAGYDFAGWYKDKELTEKIEYAILDYDMTVYAKWTANGEPTEDADVETKIVLVINDKTAVVDGKAVSNDVAPLIVNSRTYTPARFVAESLGAKVVWNEATRTVTITNDDTNIVLVVDSTTAYVNGEAVKMDASAFIADGRIFTPCRFVAEQLGANVEWDEATRTITIIQYAE